MTRSTPWVIVLAAVQLAHLITAIPYQGVNLAGLEFYTPSNDPSGDLGYVSDVNFAFLPNQNGTFATQMQHFSNEGYNMFRIPFSWQRLQAEVDGMSLFTTSYYSFLQGAVQNATSFGVTVILDMHNYARVNGQVIGQDASAPNTAALAQTWAMIATEYKDDPHVWFGIMNEPHELDMAKWTVTVQAVVTAIRNAGAQNYILIPGTGYSGIDAFLSDSLPFLSTVRNPDSSVTGLIYDIHHYWDGQGGTTGLCNSTLPRDLIPNVTTALAMANRQAFFSETGGSTGQDCVTYLNSALSLIDNSQWLGYTAWAAGEFDPRPLPGQEVLTLTPISMTSDQPQFSTIYGNFVGSANGKPVLAIMNSTASTTAATASTSVTTTSITSTSSFSTTTTTSLVASHTSPVSSGVSPTSTKTTSSAAPGHRNVVLNLKSAAMLWSFIFLMIF